MNTPIFEFFKLIAIIMGSYAFIKYNVVIVALSGKIIGFVQEVIVRLIGRQVKKANKKFERVSFLKKKSIYSKIYTYFDTMILNLELDGDGVTVGGLLFFLILSSVILTGAATVFINLGGMFIFAAIAVFILLTTSFRLTALSRAEKKEGIVMDCVDLLVSDIRGGVANSINRYRENFHPEVRVYFYEFIDNIQDMGYGFNASMTILNQRLGPEFSKFAHNAMMYEASADDTMADMFSSIIELNRTKRNLRYLNSLAFNELRSQFLISMLIIGGYAAFSIMTEPYIRDVLINTVWGKLMLIIDIIAVAAVLGYITSVKAQSL